MTLFYFLTGFSANLFATACSDKYAAGPEPAIFGILGGIIGAYLHQWEYIQLVTCFKIGAFCLILVVTVLAIFLMVMIT